MEIEIRAQNKIQLHRNLILSKFVDNQDWSEEDSKLQSKDITSSELYTVSQLNNVNLNEL